MQDWTLWTLIVTWGEDGDFEIVSSFPEYPSLSELRQEIMKYSDRYDDSYEKFFETLHKEGIEFAPEGIWSLTQHKAPKPFAMLAKDKNVVKVFYKNPTKKDVENEIISNSEFKGTPAYHDVETCVEDLFHYGHGETFARMTQEGTVPLNSWYIMWT